MCLLGKKTKWRYADMLYHSVISAKSYIKNRFKIEMDRYLQNYIGKPYFFELSLIRYPDVQLYKVDDRGFIETYDSATDAERAARKFIAHDLSKYVFLVERNSDFTSGSGHMVVDKVFGSPETAHEYIMNQKGIMGTEQHVNVSGLRLLKPCRESEDLLLHFSYVRYNGYIMVPKLVE